MYFIKIPLNVCLNLFYTYKFHKESYIQLKRLPRGRALTDPNVLVKFD
jgi:hypothetical protein